MVKFSRNHLSQFTLPIFFENSNLKNVERFFWRRTRDFTTLCWEKGRAALLLSNTEPITVVQCVALTLTFAQRVCARRISLAWPSLERAGPSQSASVGGLIFCLAAEMRKKKTQTISKTDSRREQKRWSGEELTFLWLSLSRKRLVFLF